MKDTKVIIEYLNSLKEERNYYTRCYTEFKDNINEEALKTLEFKIKWYDKQIGHFEQVLSDLVGGY